MLVWLNLVIKKDPDLFTILDYLHSVLIRGFSGGWVANFSYDHINDE